MKKITFILLFVLIIFQASAFEYGNPAGKKIFFELFRKQNQAGLRSFYPYMNMGTPDSSILHGPDGEPWHKNTYAYFPGGMAAEEQEWDYAWLRWNSALVKDSIYFDENGNDTTAVRYNFTIEGWEITDRIIRIFNENGVEETVYSYEKTSKDIHWRTIDTLSVVSTLAPEPHSQPVSQIYYLTNGGIRIPKERVDYEYDDNSLIRSCISYEWDFDIDNWAVDYSYVCNRNNLGTLFYVDYYNWNQASDAVPEEWYCRETYYYPKGYAGVNPATTSNTRIWSHNQAIYIESDANLLSVSIYNLMGQMLYNRTAKENPIVMESPLKQGIYIVKAKENNGKTTTAKIIIH